MFGPSTVPMFIMLQLLLQSGQRHSRCGRPAQSAVRFALALIVSMQIVLLLFAEKCAAFDGINIQNNNNDDDEDDHRDDDENGDAIALARCETKCWNTSRNKHSCIRSCLASSTDKPGTCPDAFMTTSSCVVHRPSRQCQEDDDGQCGGMEKCCKQCDQTSSFSCQMPRGLDKISGLPDVPTDVTVRRTRKKKSVVIDWKNAVSADDDDLKATRTGSGTVLYVVEQRTVSMRSSGNHYLTEENVVADGSAAMEKWRPHCRTAKRRAVLRNTIKPGRWYQFRVAAVNSNGTRGYSVPALYILRKEPRPPKVPDLVEIGPVVEYKDRGLCAEIRWNEPKSDLPVDQFKVFWSRRLLNGPKDLESVLVFQKSLPRDVNKFVIQDLQKDSLYFVQVQALSHYNHVIYRGEKSGHVLNTTHYKSAVVRSNIPEKLYNRIEGLKVEKLFWSKTGMMKARISWNGKNAKNIHNKNEKNEKVGVVVKWWSSNCKDPQQRHSKVTAITKESHMDVYDLQFDCRYRVEVRERHRETKTKNKNKSKRVKSIYYYDTSVTFTTPSCRDFQKRNHNNNRRQRVVCSKRV